VTASVCVSADRNRELYKMSGVWTQVGPRYHVSCRRPGPPGEGAILGRHLPAGTPA